MAKKKVIVRRQSGAVAAAGGGYAYELAETQEQDLYKKLLDSTNVRFKEAEHDHIQHNAKRLTMMWDVGGEWRTFLSLKKNERGQIADKDLEAIASDLAPFSSGKPVTKEVIRMCLRLNETYEKERIAKLAAEGVNENHVSVFLQLEDSKTRQKLEDQAVKERLTGDDVRKIVRTMANDPAQSGAIKGASKARYAQETTRQANKRQSRIDSPSKMIEYTLGKLHDDADDLADLFVSLGKVKDLEPADRSALVEPLDTLITRLGELAQTYAKLKESAETSLMEAKAQLAKEGKTQGVKGAETKKPASKADSK